VEVDAGERSALIRLGAPISEEIALTLIKKHTIIETKVEWNGFIPRTVETKMAGRLLLSEARRQSTAGEAREHFPKLLQEQGIASLPWDDSSGESRRLLERIRFFAGPFGDASGGAEPGGVTGEAQTTWDDKTLAGDARDWLLPFILNGASVGAACSGPVITSSSLKSALLNRLGWEKAGLLDAKVPEFFTLPGGRKRPIDYSSGGPLVRARLQDCFGIAEHPLVMGRPLVFHLLSPASRPIQITKDLPGFWKGSYAEVRKEMKGRYPKHFWPETP
jgi:ATP-dependent helicase HrpB